MKKAILALILFGLIIAVAASGFWLTNHFIESKKQADLFTQLAKNVVLHDAVPQETLFESAPVSSTEISPSEPTSDCSKPTSSEVSPDTEDDVVLFPAPPDQHNLDALRDTSSDCIGWISVPGTGIDYPVMWTPDNPEYYLHRNFYGDYSSYGTPFLDARSSVNENHLPTSGNLIFYGHNMFDGSMFTPLLNYTDSDYLKSHRTVQLELSSGTREYQLIAAFKTNAAEPEIYQYISLADQQSKADFIDLIQKESGQDLSGTDPDSSFITLSTCDVSRQDGRIVVIGVRNN